MTERIKNKLIALCPDAWELKETLREGWEFYFIRHSLDQNRVVDTRTIEVVIYRALEDGKYLGSASGEISPTASDEEIDRLLKDLTFRAGLVKNPFYTLNDKPLPPGSSDAAAPEAMAGNFLKAMTEAAETEEADVNSYEIFVSRMTRKYWNSCGVETVFSWPSSMVEVVVNARKDGHEIEIYRNFESGTCDPEKLKQDVEKAMKAGRDRLEAEPMPKMEGIDVLFSGQDAKELYGYFRDRMAASFKIRKFSSWEAGQPICPGQTGDKLTLEVLPSLPNSSRNMPVDEEGALVAPRFLIRDGIAENFWGGRMFSQYLGLKESSLVYNLAAGGGSQGEEELRQGDYLELVDFSDFQVDPVGGDIAGEVRLGYLHRNGQVRIVTGGSVSGSMTEAMKTMRMSREQTQVNSWLIPSVTRLKGLHITGIV